MEIDTLLERFGKDTGLGEITLDESGSCTFEVNEMELSFIYDAEGNLLFIFAEVGELPEEGRDELLQGALQANYLFQGTNGATLAVLPDSPTLVLNQSLLLENLSYETFVQVLSDFVKALELWKQMLVDYSSMLSAPMEESPTAESPMAESPAAESPMAESPMTGYLRI